MQTPFRLNDLLLVIVVITSMTVAIIFPDFGSLFQVLPVYCVIANFFLSYLSIEPSFVDKQIVKHDKNTTFQSAINQSIGSLFLLKPAFQQTFRQPEIGKNHSLRKRHFPARIIKIRILKLLLLNLNSYI